MNKAVPWNVNGVGFDAREAAREAARRQGKSLGEWLHGVIADHAAGLGVAEADMAEPQKIDAVTSKLERLSARSAEHDRHIGAETRPSRDDRQDMRQDRLQDRRPNRSRIDSDDTHFENDDISHRPRRRPRTRASSDAAEFLLEEAIDAMEHRALRAERRTDKALQSMAELLQRNETRRERERDSVSTLARQLSDIETRLNDRLTQTDDNPVKSALARLEARLDTIGRRGAAEALARQQAEEGRRVVEAPAKSTDGPDSLHRLEEKLNTILDAVHAKAPRPSAEASPIALAASQAAAQTVFGRGRLGDAIADITRRQQALEPNSSAVSLRDAILRRGNAAARRPQGRQEEPRYQEPRYQEPRYAEPRFSEPRHQEPRYREQPAFVEMQGEITALASKIEDLRHDIASERRSKQQPLGDLGAMRAEIAAMSDGLRGLVPHDRLAGIEGSVRALSDRLSASQTSGWRESELRSAAVDLDSEARDKIDSLQHDLATIDGKLDELRGPGIEPAAVSRIQDQMQEIRDLIADSATRSGAVERIETQIADLNDRFDRRARFGGPRDLDAVDSEAVGSESLAKIESRLEDLAVKIDTAVMQGARRDAMQDRNATPSAADLESLVRDLGRKMEAAQSPSAGHEALDALQSQIAALSSQFERSDGGLAKLSSLERSMRELFVHLEETRASVETSAQRAAREVLRIAVEDGRAHTEKGTATSLATMQALQDDADARTNATLSAVHETLEKVVDRMSAMETDIAEVRSRPQVAAKATQPGPVAVKAPSAKSTPPMSAAAKPAPATSSPAMPAPAARAARGDSFVDPMLGHRPGAPAAGRPAISLDLDDDHRRASFIAAARRAAKAAQTDPSVADLKRPLAATGTDSAVRASLVAQSRDYVARHKRPVLLSIAALFVIVGTMALVQRMGLGGGETLMADATPPAPITRAVDPRPVSRPTRQLAELTPSALPRSAPAIAKPIPGSDPIQTGSIPSLPAFAARAPTPQQPLPVLPAALTKMARGGDSAAEYVLGTQYAEGRLVQRDFKEAANWYQKAADQGVIPAQYRLAALYEKGLGVIQDKARAKALYIRAAEAGNPRAMHNLAVMLADGDGHPDYEGAATWFRKAAQYGVHDSQYNLAILLARGLGTQQSFVQSYQWFAIAAQQNDVDAGKKRDEVATRLNANDLAVAKALAAAYRARTPDVAATDVQPPPGGWDGAAAPSSLNSPRAKISML